MPPWPGTQGAYVDLQDDFVLPSPPFFLLSPLISQHPTSQTTLSSALCDVIHWAVPFCPTAPTLSLPAFASRLSVAGRAPRLWIYLRFISALETQGEGRPRLTDETEFWSVHGGTEEGQIY
jgi:hypothetical protein